MTSPLSRLALGTVQFGIPYGISNQSGQIPAEAVGLILQECQKQGITTLDTASAYGQSEAVLGRFFSETGRQDWFHTVTKVPPQPSRVLRDDLQASLERLGLPAVDGYLFHHYKTWSEAPWLWEQMLEIRSEGLASRVGFSLYSPDELESLWANGVNPDLIQIPFSVLDQRFLPLLSECRSRGTAVHVRSVFLQGLVFLEPNGLPSFFSSAQQQLRNLRIVAESIGITPAHLCLAFPLLEERIERIVIGVESVQNLTQNCGVVGFLNRIEHAGIDWNSFAVTDTKVLLPMNWPPKK